VEFTPGERQILSQLRELYKSTSQREHPLGKITSQWPAMHVDAYRDVLRGLVAKKLLEPANKGQAVRITGAGMRAMGLDEAAAIKAANPGAVVRDRRPPASAASPSTTASGKQHHILRNQRLGLTGRFVFIAIAASAIVLLWLFLWPR
jgi:hypothetical protein